MQKTCVLCTNVPEFLALVMKTRGKGITKILVGADAGQGSFKICCNCVEDIQKEQCKDPKKHALSSKSQTQYLDAGVKRTFILALGKGVPETYNNFKSFLNELKLSEIDSINTYDLKLELIACGMEGQQGGTYPCHYCHARAVRKNGKIIRWEKGELRTI